MRRPGLTIKQRKAYDYIVRYYEKKGVMPSVRDISRGCRFSSTSTASHLIDELVERKYLEKVPNKWRGLRLIEEDELIPKCPHCGGKLLN